MYSSRTDIYYNSCFRRRIHSGPFGTGCHLYLLQNYTVNQLVSTICQRSSDPFYVVTYNIKWVTTSRPHSSQYWPLKKRLIKYSSFFLLHDIKSCLLMQWCGFRSGDFLTAGFVTFPPDPDHTCNYGWILYSIYILLIFIYIFPLGRPVNFKLCAWNRKR